MAINRIPAATVPPISAADWAALNTMVAALLLGVEVPRRIVGTDVVKGALFQVGGTLYLAVSDTAITGTPSAYVKLTPAGDGSTLSAAFVASLAIDDVAWNSTYNGYYDDDGAGSNLYIFDEGKARTAGEIPAIMRDRDQPVPLGTGWLAALAVNLGANWATAFAASAGAGMLAQLLTVDGHESGLDADLLDGYEGSAIMGLTAGDYVIYAPEVIEFGNESAVHQCFTLKIRKAGTIRVRTIASVSPPDAGSSEITDPEAALMNFRVYKNGSAIGTSHTVYNTSSERVPSMTVNDDISVAVGDILHMRVQTQNMVNGSSSILAKYQCGEEGPLYSELE